MSTQRYLDDAIVQSKRAAQDYVVRVVSLVIEDVDYLYVIDGHHSYAAAIEDSEQPELEDVTHLYRGEIERIGDLAWLDAHHYGDDPYDPITGHCIW